MSKGFVIEASARWYTCAPPLHSALQQHCTIMHTYSLCQPLHMHTLSLPLSSTYHAICSQSWENGHLSWDIIHSMGMWSVNVHVVFCWKAWVKHVGVDVLRVSYLLPNMCVCVMCMCPCLKDRKRVHNSRLKSLCTPVTLSLQKTEDWISASDILLQFICTHTGEPETPSLLLHNIHNFLISS